MNYLPILLKFKWLIGAVALATSVYSVLDHFEKKGYNRAVTELRVVTNEKIQKATNKAIKLATKELQKALDKQQTMFDTELKRVKDERLVEYVTDEIIEYVDRVVISTDCNVINDDIIRLLNKAVHTSNAASNKSTKSGN